VLNGGLRNARQSEYLYIGRAYTSRAQQPAGAAARWWRPPEGAAQMNGKVMIWLAGVLLCGLLGRPGAGGAFAAEPLSDASLARETGGGYLDCPTTGWGNCSGGLGRVCSPLDPNGPPPPATMDCVARWPGQSVECVTGTNSCVNGYCPSYYEYKKPASWNESLHHWTCPTGCGNEQQQKDISCLGCACKMQRPGG